MATDNEDRISLIELDIPAAKPATARQAIPTVRDRDGMALDAVTRQPLPLPLPPTPAPVFAEDRRPAVAFCDCPIGTRGDTDSRNVCIACKLPRRPLRRPAGVPAATVSAESNAVAASLGVSQLGTGRARADVAEILTPRETALREMRERLRTGRGATADDLRKWEVMFASVTETVSANRNGYVRHTEIVAGAKTDASGIFTGFGGQGTMTRGTMLAKLREAGAPESWALPNKTAHAQAGRVLQGLAHGGLIVRAARLNRADPQLAAAQARWTVGTANGGAGVGGAFGTTRLVVTLGTDDRLTIEGDVDLGVRVRTEFEKALATEEYSATDVSGWLAGILIGQYRAARVGGNWYIRARYAVDAERLLTVFSRGWGRDWLIPAIPMSTGEQLAAGMVKSFIIEAEATLSVYAKELAKAQAHGKNEIGSDRARTLHAEIRQLAERAAGWAMMLGDRHVAELRTKLSIAANKISESIDGLTQRFELIFDGLREEAARRDSGASR